MDAIDRKIIGTLQENGRITNVELARMNNLAPSSMLERVRRLEEKGLIEGYQAVLNPKKLGYNVDSIVLVTLGRHQGSGVEVFETEVLKIPEVRACYHVAGRYDYIVLISVCDIEHLGKLVKHKLGYMTGVERIETLLSLQTIKRDKGYALEPLMEFGKQDMDTEEL